MNIRVLVVFAILLASASLAGSIALMGLKQPMMPPLRMQAR